MARHRVFFSYTGADRNVVDVLKAKLEEETDVECFAFEHDMRFGDNIVEEVRQRLHWCNFFVPVITQKNADRPWLIFEINTAVIRAFEKECTLLPLLSDISGDDLSADLRQYNALSVDDSGNYINLFAKRLFNNSRENDNRRWDLFRPLPRDFDLPALLSWKMRLSSLHGRSGELKELLQWADDEQPGARVRIISGPGGAGKTRLAGEVAMELWKSGWDTQFIHTVDGVPTTKGIASLWIIDYPEEQQDLAKFFRQIRSLRPAHRVRILMLTRLPREWWVKHSALRTAHAPDLLGETFDLEIEEISAENTIRLYHEVANTVGQWFNKDVPKITDEELIEWRSLEPEHRLPLYITALALRMVSSEATKLDLNGGQVIRELVWRERARVDIYGSQDPEKPEEWPSRVLALASLTECLTGETLKNLSDDSLEVGLPPPNKVVDTLRKTPLWNNKQHGVLPLQPDIFAAVFLHEVLSSREDVAAEWLWATIASELAKDPSIIRDRIGRLIFDVHKICEENESNLSNWLSQMVTKDPERALKLKDIACDDRPPEFLLPLLVEINKSILAGAYVPPEEQLVIQRILGYQLLRLERNADAQEVFQDAVEKCQSTKCDSELAELLRGLSSAIDDNDYDDKIATASRALEIQRKSATNSDVSSQDALARALNTYALTLRPLDDKTHEELKACEECAAIYNKLLDLVEHDERHVYEDNYARALFNLTNAQWSVDQKENALESIQQSVEIRRRLYADYRWRYARYFAMSLKQYAFYAVEMGDPAGDAQSAAQETVEIYTDLYKANPAQFGIDLVLAIGARASAASAVGENDKEMKFRTEQAELIKKVLAEGGIQRYSKHLVSITLHLVGVGNDAVNRNPEMAIEVCSQAIDILEALRSNERQLWNSTLHYVLVGGYLNRGNVYKNTTQKNAIEDYGIGVKETENLKAEFGFTPEAEVARVLCLLNRCIEFIKADELELASNDFNNAVACEKGIRQELGDKWSISEYNQVLMSLDVLGRFETKMRSTDVKKLHSLTVDITKAMLERNMVSQVDTIKHLLKLSVKTALIDREATLIYLRDAVNIAKKVDLSTFNDNHDTALFYNDTAYRIGLIADTLKEYQYIDFAVELSRNAVELPLDQKQLLWAQSRETLGFTTGLLNRIKPNTTIREESIMAFRDAIRYFREHNKENEIQVSIDDWVKVHGAYSE